MDLSCLTSLVDSGKLAGYARAVVASLIGLAIAKWPVLATILDPTTQTAIGVVAAGIAVGLWSHIAKSIADGSVKANDVVNAAKKTAPLLAVIVLATSIAGCTTAQLAAFNKSASEIEAKVAEFIAKVKAKYPVVLSEAQNTVTLACGIVPAVQVNITNFSGSLSSPSAKVRAALDEANKDAAIAVAACAQYTAQINSSTPPTLSQTINFGLAIWNAYQAGKSAYQKATVAASS
jgi:hypothetical protein